MNYSRPSAFLLLTAVAFLFAAPAQASRDAVQFASDIIVPQGQSVHDAVCFFCSVKVDGTAEHDIVVFFGSVQIAGQANHDIVDFFGDIHVGPGASVGHDLVNFFGTTRLAENAAVGNDVVSMFGAMRVADTAAITGNRVVEPFFLLLIPLGILAAFVFGIVALVRRVRQPPFPGYPFPPPR
jgi:hypothetical protein